MRGGEGVACVCKSVHSWLLGVLGGDDILGGPRSTEEEWCVTFDLQIKA